MKKYVSQIDNENFVYPNNSPAEYDVEITHEINDNCVSGTTTVGPNERRWETDDANNSGQWSYSGTSYYSGVTYIMINKTDSDGNNQEDWLNYFEEGDTIKLFGPSGVYGYYTITSDPAFPIGDFIKFSVSVTESNGQIARSTSVLFVLEKATNASICSDANITIVSGASASGITFEYDWTWSLNGAEPFLNQDGDLVVYTVHSQIPQAEFFKPWFMVDYEKETYTGQTSSSGTGTITIEPDDFGLDFFINGNYYFEFRFVGHRCVYPVAVCATVEGLPDVSTWDIDEVTKVSEKIMKITHTGDTTYCVSIKPEWSRDGTTWYPDSPNAGYCSGTAYCITGPQYDTIYFRLTQFLSYGGYVVSSVVPYVYSDPVLDSVTGVTGETGYTYSVEFTPTSDCAGVVIQWSRNQVDWVNATAELDCDVTQPVEVDTGDQTDIPYWRIKQVTGADQDVKEDAYSDVKTAT